jgi:hypothetical protein
MLYHEINACKDQLYYTTWINHVSFYSSRLHDKEYIWQQEYGYQKLKWKMTLLNRWVVFVGSAIDSRVKPPDAKIPVLETQYGVKEVEHNSRVEWCCEHMWT